MIIDYIIGDYKAIIFKLTIVSILWGLVFLAIAVDLFFGIKKSKALGDFTTSEGYKRSVEKFALYYAMLFFALIFDVIIPVSYFLEFPLSAIPLVTLLCTIGLVLTEAKSVREKGSEKLRRQTTESFTQLLKVIEKHGIPKNISELVNDAISSKGSETNKNTQDE